MRSSVMSRAPLMAACVAVGLAAQVMGTVVDFSSPTVYQPATMADFTYSNFSGDMSANQAWTTPSPGTWTDTFNSSWNYGGDWNYAASIVNTSGLVGNYFKVSADVTVTQAASPWDTGFSVLGGASQKGGANNGDGWYGAGINFSGGVAYLDIISQGGWGAGVSSIGGNKPITFFTVGNAYHLEVTGDYAGGQLTLMASLTDLSDSANTLQVTTGAMSNPHAGTYFGFHDMYPGTGGGISGVVNYGNFAIGNTVPEPATLGALGLVSMSLLVRRRRLA